jgi:aspartate kinase
MDKGKNIKIGGIMQSTDLGMVGVMSTPDRPGIASSIMDSLGQHGVNVEFIVQCIDLNNLSNIVFCVKEASVDHALSLLEEVRREVGAQRIIVTRDVAIISIFGPDFRQRPGIAGAMFRALADQGINIMSISTSISTVSCVIESDRLAKAVQAIRDTFELP